MSPRPRARGVVWGAGAVALVAIAMATTELIGLGAYPPGVERTQVDLHESVPDASAAPRPTVETRSLLRIAVAPVVSPERSLEKYRAFVEYVAGAVDRRPAFLRRRTYAEINELVRHERCDMALVCTHPFVLGEKQFGMRALVIPVIGGQTVYHSYIVVLNSDPATSLLDLRARRFGSADLMSTSGWLFPATWLRREGEDPERFFSEHVITGSHDRSVGAVVSGLVDGAAVDSLVYDEMALEDAALLGKTKIVMKSHAFGMPPLVVPAGIDPDLEKRLRAVLLGMHTSPEGERTLQALGIERFVAPEPGLYDSIRKLVGEPGDVR